MDSPETSDLLEKRLKRNIIRLMRSWSIETTLPKASDINALRANLPAGTRVYLSALPHVPAEKLVEQVGQISLAGFEPVPHLAVRNFQSRDHIGQFLAGVGKQGLVRRVLVIAGDRKTPVGPFADSLQLIESGLLQECGIDHIGIAGYPDGHPNISHDDLMKGLRAKVIAARRGNLNVEVVTQFCFDAKAILSWLLKLRYQFPDLPVRLGLAGPAGKTTLFRYALRCGVRASARGLGRGLSLIGNMNGESTPLRIIRTMAEGWVAQDGLAVNLHFYSFGGTGRTAKWALSLSNGEIDAARSER